MAWKLLDLLFGGKTAPEPAPQPLLLPTRAQVLQTAADEARQALRETCRKDGVTIEEIAAAQERDQIARDALHSYWDEERDRWDEQASEAAPERMGAVG